MRTLHNLITFPLCKEVDMDGIYQSRGELTATKLSDETIENKLVEEMVAAAEICCTVFLAKWWIQKLSFWI